MPGLIRGVARTAVIAGTATAVSNRVSRRQAGRWAAQEQQPAGSGYGYPPQPAAAPPEDDMNRRIEQLKDLAEMQAQGLLTEAEFQEQKARVLGRG